MRPRQATCVAIGATAILIEGKPNSGKSSLALSLIDRGAILIGDDSVILQEHDGKLFASPHPETRGLLEVRNLGLLEMPVCESAPVGLLIRLDANAPRFIDEAQTESIEGVKIPVIVMWPDSSNMAMKAELALDRYGI